MFRRMLRTRGISIKWWKFYLSRGNSLNSGWQHVDPIKTNVCRNSFLNNGKCKCVRSRESSALVFSAFGRIRNMPVRQKPLRWILPDKIVSVEVFVSLINSKSRRLLHSNLLRYVFGRIFLVAFLFFFLRHESKREESSNGKTLYRQFTLWNGISKRDEKRFFQWRHQRSMTFDYKSSQIFSSKLILSCIMLPT